MTIFPICWQPLANGQQIQKGAFYVIFLWNLFKRKENSILYQIPFFAHKVFTGTAPFVFVTPWWAFNEVVKDLDIKKITDSGLAFGCLQQDSKLTIGSFVISLKVVLGQPIPLLSLEYQLPGIGMEYNSSKCTLLVGDIHQRSLLITRV